MGGSSLNITKYAKCKWSKYINWKTDWQSEYNEKSVNPPGRHYPKYVVTKQESCKTDAKTDKIERKANPHLH